MSSTKKKPVADLDAPALRRSTRTIISVLLVFHLTAIFVPPFFFETTSGGESSPFARQLLALFQQYVDAAFLNHGYAFFAPDPGPSHLVRYRLEFDDGRPPVEQTFPDISRHWPRLLYHRHFMLAEQLHSDFVPPEPPPGLDPEQLRNWQRGRDRYVAKWESYKNHLTAKYGAARVELVRIEHLLPPPIIPPGGINLHDPNSFIELSEDAMPEPLFPDVPRREVGP